MLSHRQDQAAGLRKLLAMNAASSFAVVGGGRGTGRTSLVVNLADTLAREGKRVLILDENTGGIAATLGWAAHRDFLHVLGGECSVEEAVSKISANVVLLPCARVARALPRIGASARAQLIDRLGNLSRRYDVVLIDSGEGLPTVGQIAHDMLVVTLPDVTAVTDAYALIKRLHQDCARGHFRVVVNRASSESEAHAAFGNIARVAGRNLGISLEFAGWIPYDDRLFETIRAGAQNRRPNISAHAFRRLADTLVRIPRSVSGGRDSQLNSLPAAPVFPLAAVCPV